MGIPILISVTAAIVVGVGGFLLGWRWPRSAARRGDDGRKTARGALPWSLMAVGLVAVATTNAFVARSVATDQPVVPAPITGDGATAVEQADAAQELPDQGANAPAASTSEPAAWPALPECFKDDYLVHEKASARRPHYVAENKSSVFPPQSLVSMMMVDDDRIIGGLRIAFVPTGGFSAHDVVDASCAPVEFSEDQGDAPQSRVALASSSWR